MVHVPLLGHPAGGGILMICECGNTMKLLHFAEYKEFIVYTWQCPVCGYLKITKEYK
jgi:hypothetical protein